MVSNKIRDILINAGNLLGAGCFCRNGERVGGESGGLEEAGHLVFVDGAAELGEFHVLEEAVGLAIAQFDAGVAADCLLAGSDCDVGRTGEILNLNVRIVFVGNLLSITFHAVEKRCAHAAHRSILRGVETAFLAGLTDENSGAVNDDEIGRRRVVVKGKAAWRGVIDLA